MLQWHPPGHRGEAAPLVRVRGASLLALLSTGKCGPSRRAPFGSRPSAFAGPRRRAGLPAGWGFNFNGKLTTEGPPGRGPARRPARAASRLGPVTGGRRGSGSQPNSESQPASEVGEAQWVSRVTSRSWPGRAPVLRCTPAPRAPGPAAARWPGDRLRLPRTEPIPARSDSVPPGQVPR